MGTKVPCEWSSACKAPVCVCEWGAPFNESPVCVCEWGAPFNGSPVCVCEWGAPFNEAPVCVCEWGAPFNEAPVCVCEWGAPFNGAPVCVCEPFTGYFGHRGARVPKTKVYLSTTHAMSKETCIYANTPIRGTYLYKKGTHKGDLSMWVLPY